MVIHRTYSWVIISLFIPCQPQFSDWEYSTEGACPIPPSPCLHTVVVGVWTPTEHGQYPNHLCDFREEVLWRLLEKHVEVLLGQWAGSGWSGHTGWTPEASLSKWILSWTQTKKTIKPSTFVWLYLVFLLPSQEVAFFKEQDWPQSVSAGVRDSKWKQLRTG